SKKGAKLNFTIKNTRKIEKCRFGKSSFFMYNGPIKYKGCICMLSAKTKKGQMVTLAVLKKAQIEEMRLEEFYCPACKETVIIKAGEKTIPHFAHFSKSVCINKSGEGMQHQKGKLLLYSWLQKQSIDVQIEYYLPEIKQRPDLFFSIGDKKVAIEFQCVKIS